MSFQPFLGAGFVRALVQLAIGGVFGLVVDGGGALGELCLGAPVRHSRPLAVQSDGSITVPIGELTLSANVPSAGDTWHYQIWYRDADPIGTGPVTRFTEAVTVTYR